MFDFNGVDRFGNIQLSNVAQVDVSSDRGGAISANGHNVILSEGAQFASISFGPFAGGDITVMATESLQVLGTTTIPGLFEPFIAQGGVLVPQFSSISTDTAAGNAGNINIITRRLAIRDGARITANADPNRLEG
ncbi:MAG: hemagglutination protein, partial [Pseudomonadota bacterium]